MNVFCMEAAMKPFLLCINSHIVDIVSIVWLGWFGAVDGFGHVQFFYGLGGTGLVQLHQNISRQQTTEEWL